MLRGIANQVNENWKSAFIGALVIHLALAIFSIVAPNLWKRSRPNPPVYTVKVFETVDLPSSKKAIPKEQAPRVKTKPKVKEKEAKVAPLPTKSKPKLKKAVSPRPKKPKPKPVATKDTDKLLSKRLKSLEERVKEKETVSPVSPKIPNRKQEKLAPKLDELTPADPSRRAKIQKPPPPQSPGLLLQFQNQEVLLNLLASEKIHIFGRAKATGFDLFFTGAVQDDTVCFEGVSELPDHLWEIKNHEVQTYFIDLMTKTYPSIRSFSSKQILVCFIDTDLEKRVDQTYSQLQSEGKNGVLSITRSGDVEFQKSSSEPAPLTTGVVD